jgi:hypothetical protein
MTSASTIRFTQKTNLSKAGNKSCLFRCKNRLCHATVSLQTGLNDGIYSIIEPFEITNLNEIHVQSYQLNKLQNKESIGVY